MKLFSKILVSSSLMASFSPLYAANSPLGISGNLTLTTDYVFRGLTQTNEEPAIQGGFNVEHDSGVYAGLWGSSLNFDEAGVEDRAHVEIDYSVGYAQHLPSGTTYGLGWAYYTYPGAGGHLNYDFHEVVLDLGYERAGTTFGFAYAYSPEFFGEVGQAHYFQLKLGQTTSQGLGLNAYVGRQAFSDNDMAGDDYTDYGVSMSYSIQNYFDVSINYTDTDLDNVEAAKGRAFFMISKDF